MPACVRVRSQRPTVFAYQGQSLFLEMQSEMRQPSQFAMACMVACIHAEAQTPDGRMRAPYTSRSHSSVRALVRTDGVMTSVYATTVVVAYGVQGDSVAGFLPDSLAAGPLKMVVGACLAFHIAIAYTSSPRSHSVHSPTPSYRAASMVQHWSLRPNR